MLPTQLSSLADCSPLYVVEVSAERFRVVRRQRSDEEIFGGLAAMRVCRNRLVENGTVTLASLDCLVAAFAFVITGRHGLVAVLQLLPKLRKELEIC